MPNVDFRLVSVDEKTKCHRTHRSKYDSVIDEFMDRGSRLVRVDGLPRGAGYVASLLAKRIEKRGLEGRVRASSAMGFVFLELVEP
jgi:hypothetical protein